MRLDKQADGSFTLINVKENPSGLSTAHDLETKVAVLTEAEVAQIVADFGGDTATQKVIQALKDQIAEQNETHATLEKQSSALTAEKNALAGRTDELVLQAQALEVENGKLKAALADLAKPVEPAPVVEQTPSPVPADVSLPVAEVAAVDAAQVTANGSN